MLRAQWFKKTLLVALVLAIAGSAVPASLFAVTPESDWFKGTPEMHDPFSIGNSVPPYSINGNRSCTAQKVITKPRKILPFWPYYQPEESHESCIVNTSFGAVSQSGYMQAAGSTTFGRVTHPNGATMTLLPVPRSASAIYIASNPPNGVSLHMIQDFLSNIESATDAFGQVTYRVKPGTTLISLRTSTGSLAGVQLDSVSFSSNGGWMIADIPFVGLARINTATMEMTIFDSPLFNYNVGVAPGVQSAITANGRYAVVGSRSFNQLRLYDLEACPTTGRCRYKDLWQYFKGQVPGFNGAARIRFSSDYSLKLYVTSKIGNTQSTTRMVLTAKGHPPANFGYLGLGDSFASGEGAYQYKAATDAGKNKCHLSQRSYPYLIANDLGINEMESVACSGAKIRDIQDRSDDYLNDSQAKGKNTKSYDSEIYTGFLPGYRAQIQFINQNSPDIITISTFGNDIGFDKKIKRCLEPDTCYASYEDRLEIVRQINGQFDRLVGMYSDIKEEMEGKKVYVIGYPEIAMDDGICGGNVRLNAQEVKFSNQLVRYLNSVVKAAASKAGFFYVDVEGVFYGHRLCETIGPNEAVNGITSGNDIVDIPFTDFGGPVGNESFHPNDMGHRLFKETILDKTNGFTADMPAADPAATPPQESDNLEILKNTPKSNRKLHQANYDESLGNDVVVRGGIWGGVVDTSKTALKGLVPGTTVWLHSEPTLLGTFTPGANGSLSFEVTIPSNIPAGYHTIHVYSTNLAGEPVDIQKVIYVAASLEDYDGDGVLNADDNCGYGPASGVDHDQDGNDDACDGQISDPPVIAAENRIALSNGDPKPPENNPETAAGDEQPALAEPPVGGGQVLGATGGADSAPYAATPYQNPGPGSPQVAGINTAGAHEQTAPTATGPGGKNYWPLVFIPAGLLALIILAYARKNFTD